MNREYPPRYELWEFLATLTYESVKHEYMGVDRSLLSLIEKESLKASSHEQQYTTLTRLSTKCHRAAA